MKNFSLALRNLARNRRRSLATLLTIRIGDTTRPSAVNEVPYFQSGGKYTEAVTARSDI